MNILLLNCYSRNALAVINSLGSNFTVFGATAQVDHFFFFNYNPEKVFKSRKLESIYRYPNATKYPKECCKAIINLSNNLNIDLIIPVGTDLTNLASKYKQQIERASKAKVAAENFDKLEPLTDKWKSYDLLKSKGVPFPITAHVHDNSSAKDAATQVPFPAVLKPCNSSASIGVMFFDTKDDYLDFLEDQFFRQNSRFSSYVLQEKVNGDLHDVTSCSFQGKPYSLLTQQRHLALFDFGGGGIINRTTDDKQMKEVASKILKLLDWNGACLFDFLKTSEGKLYLLEINPKIWGTTQLTISAGSNIVEQIIDIFYHQKEPASYLDYRENLLYKWYFPEIIFHLIQKPRTVGVLWRRVKKVLSNNGAEKCLNNLKIKDLLHNIGIVLDRESPKW